MATDRQKYDITFEKFRNICHNGTLENVKDFFLKDKKYFTADYYGNAVANRVYYHVCCRKGYFEICKFLLSQNVINQRNINLGFISLCEEGHLNIIKLLLENEKYREELIIRNIDEGLCKALFYNHVDIVFLFFNNEFFNNKISYSNLLITACCRGRLDLVKYIHESKGVSNKKNYELALRNACLSKYIDVVEYMLEHCKEEVEDYFYNSGFLEKQIKDYSNKVMYAKKDHEKSYYNYKLEFFKDKLANKNNH